MVTLVFTILLISVIFKLIEFALKAAWGITKFVLYVVLFPAVLIVLAVSGCMIVAIPLLIISGIILIIKSALLVA